MSDKVDRLIHAITDLSHEELKTLLDFLRRKYRFVLLTDRAKFKQLWNDPANGFGRKQIQLLGFLDTDKPVSNRSLIEQLWPSELSRLRPRTIAGMQLGDAGELQRKIQALRPRLRQLKSSTNKRLRKLRFAWLINCPKPGYLALAALS